MAQPYPYETSYVDDSDQSTTLFLGDLSIHCDEKDLRELFHPFGIIEAIRVKRNGTDHSSLSYGFLKFSTRESAEQAMLHLNGVMFCGRSLKIRWAESKTAFKPKVMKERKYVETAQLHVSFLTKQIDLLITEATLRALFGVYGEVVDVALKKSQVDHNLQVQSGYGFVHYALTPEGIRSALMAVQNVHRKCIDQVTYDCSISRSLQEHLAMTNSLTNIVSISTNSPAMNGVSPMSVASEMAGIADNYSIYKSNNSFDYAADHNQMTLPLSLNNDAYMNQVQVQGRVRIPQPVPRHPHSNDVRHRATFNAGPFGQVPPTYRSSSPHQFRDYEPHGMMYHSDLLNQSPARNLSEDSLTFGTRSPSVCSIDHHNDMTNVSGSTSCDGFSVTSPATQKHKIFTFADDLSSVDSFGGASVSYSPTTLNIAPPQYQQTYQMRSGYEAPMPQHLYEQTNYVNRSSPVQPYYAQRASPSLEQPQQVYDYHACNVPQYSNHSFPQAQNHAIRVNSHPYDQKINW